VVTHAHIDHYGLAGRLMEVTGAEADDAQPHRPRLREVPPSRHRPGRGAADTYADHGVSEAERTDLPIT
jgi:glyoxylase-like metal-dependent hydrolase (beta-lactamase superfamily II)